MKKPDTKPAAQLSRLAALAAEEQLRREKRKAEASLLEFARQAWHVLEPGRKFVEGWHIEVICLHLEAVASGRIKRLIINLPPRHMKSLLCSVLFPLWVWLTDPSKRYIVASYELPLSTELADKMRAIIRSPWFQERWGSKVQLTEGQDVKTFYTTTATGHRYSTAVKGGGTGRGSDITIIDDPHNTKKVESDPERKAAHDFYHSVLNTRGNDPAAYAIIVVAQRSHEDDLCGHLEAAEPGEWEVLNLPAHYDGVRRSTSLGEYDARQEIGEPLWPERYPEPELAKLARSLGPYRASAQLEQKPVPPGGGMFKREDFKLEEIAPSQVERVRGWDLAATEEGAADDPDYTVGVLLGRDRFDEWWVLDVVRERTSDPEGLIASTAVTDGDEVPIAVPQDPAAAGKLVFRAIKKRLSGFEVRGYPQSGSKVARASAWAAVVREGKWHVLLDHWTEEYLREVVKFWFARHDDQVDATSIAFESILTEGGAWSGGAGTITNDDISRLPGLRAGR